FAAAIQRNSFVRSADRLSPIGAIALTFLFAARAAVAINCGQTLTGNINPAGETEQQPFDALAGEVVAITIDASPGSPIQPVIKLFGPTGQVALNGSVGFCGPGVCISASLPASGAYHFDVNDAGLNEIGAYDATLQPVTPTLNGAQCG